jgi:hypothetical protein
MHQQKSGASGMKMSWQVDTDRLVCQWSEVEERVQYKPLWVQGVSGNAHTENVSPSLLDFTRLSPFGGGRDWYAYAPAPRRNSRV